MLECAGWLKGAPVQKLLPSCCLIPEPHLPDQLALFIFFCARKPWASILSCKHKIFVAKPALL